MEKNRPPGLKPHSVEGGNLSDITSAGSIYHFLLELHKQFGPIASFWWGKTYTVSIASPELFEEQLELTERPAEPYKYFDPLLFGPQSIQFANLEDGINRRKHYSKALNKDAVKRYIPQFQEVADEIASKWSNMLEEPSIPLTREMSMYCVKAVLHTLFGNLMKNKSDVLDFRADTDELWAELEASVIEPRAEKQIKHMEEDRRDLNKLIGNMIKDRKSSSAKISEETLLDCILTYTDDDEIQLADALEFSTCGQYVLEYCKLYLYRILDLTSAFYHIANNSDVQKKLYEEIQTVLGDEAVSGTNIGELVYLQQVLDEVLRCCIPGCFGSRVQYSDSKLGGYDIPKNTPVIHAINAAMKNETIWSDPDRFDPERFSKQNCEKRSSLWFCPYGVGKRQCLVRHFPYPAAAVVLVTLLRKFKVHLVDSEKKLSINYGLAQHLTEEIFIRIEQR